MRTYLFIQLADRFTNSKNGVARGWEYGFGIHYPTERGYSCSSNGNKTMFGVPAAYRQSFKLELIVHNQWTIFR